MTRWLRKRWGWLALTAMLGTSVLGLPGCGGGALSSAAKSGDMTSFRSALKQRLKEGSVDVGEAQDVAASLLGRQVMAAQGPVGRKGLLTAQSCAQEVDGPLARRADADDELAALAALIRQDSGLDGPLSRARLLSRDESHWRAAAARSLQVRGTDGANASRASVWRRKLMADASLDVRKAALSAAIDAADPEDGGAVLEAARLDPDRDARQLAISAAGAIASDKTIGGLRDVWVAADEQDRLAIIKAWGRASRTPVRMLDAGDSCLEALGEDKRCSAWQELWRLSQSDTGMPGVQAALELLQGVEPGDAKTVEGNAVALLERTIDESATRVRIAAIAGAPLSFAHLVEAIVQASEKATDDRVKIAALARMTELSGKERKTALDALVKLAKGDGLASEEAKDALVVARDKRVVPLLSKDAKATAPADRRRAASAYATLGEVNAVLALLADQDATVRAHASCAILGMSD